MGASVSRSVRACADGRWKLTLWKLDGTGDPIDAPWVCSSWRCEKCRRFVAAIDYARIAHALYERPTWIYCVLTLADIGEPRELWPKCAARWDTLRKRLQRTYGALAYMQTWEQQESGRPHVNVVLHSERLCADVAARGFTPRGAPAWRKTWRTWAMAAGWGPVTWVEELRPGGREREGLASYLVKLSLSLGAGALARGSKLAAELVRADLKHQLPVYAPKGFRRLRTSRGLLPPRFRGDGWSGTLRPAEGRAWSWKDVHCHEARRERRALQLEAVLAKLERDDLPIPEVLLHAAKATCPQRPV